MRGCRRTAAGTPSSKTGFHQKDMSIANTSFRSEWLEYYNNLDVGPFLEVMEKMRGFYVELGLDTFKDVVSLQYLTRGTLRGPNVPPGAVRTKRGGVQNVERGRRGEGQTWFLPESTRQARPRFEVISTTTQRLPKGFWVMS